VKVSPERLAQMRLDIVECEKTEAYFEADFGLGDVRDLVEDVTLLRGMVAALVFESLPGDALRCRMCGKTCSPSEVDAQLVPADVAHLGSCDAGFVLPKGWPKCCPEVE
jgi:hypothetical protein